MFLFKGEFFFSLDFNQEIIFLIKEIDDDFYYCYIVVENRYLEQVVYVRGGKSFLGGYSRALGFRRANRGDRFFQE